MAPHRQDPVPVSCCPPAALDRTARHELIGFFSHQCDRELALVSGVRVTALTATLLVLIAISIASAIRLTGALLVDALTLLPALAARRLGTTLPSICAWAIVVSLASNTTGFAIAIVFDLPPGPVLVLVAGTVALLANLIPSTRKTSNNDRNGTQCAETAPTPLSSLH